MSLDDAGFRQSSTDEDRRSWDGYVHARTVIDHEHRMIHDGMAFHVTHRVASLANGASFDILYSPPAFSFPHLTALLVSLADSPCDVLSYENVVTSDDGTALTPFNRDRNSTKTAQMGVTHSPTITDLGDLVHDRFVPDAGGQGSNSIGIITPNFGEEWILKPSTKMMTRVTNNSGGAITLTFEALWYEISYKS